MSTDKQALAYKTDAKDVLSRLSTISVAGHGMIAQLLKEGNEAINKDEHAKAQGLLIKALQRTYDSRQLLNGSSQSMRGLAAMHLAACYHGQGNISAALLHYLEAKDAFSAGLDGYNTAIALYACGLAYAWSKQETKISDIIQELGSGYGGQTLCDRLTKRSKEIDEMLAIPPPSEMPSTTPDAQPEDPTRTATVSSATSATKESQLTPDWAVRLVAFSLLIILLVIVVVYLVGLSVEPLITALTLGFFTLVLYYIFDHRLEVSVPSGCYTVLKRGSELLVETRQTPFARRPFDSVVAFVPTYAHYVQPPKEKIPSGPETRTEIQLVISYEIDKAPDDALTRQQVKKAVTVAQEVISLKVNVQTKKDQKPLWPADLTRAWERRLKDEISMALREVLPQYAVKDLFCDRGTKKSPACEQIKINLNNRTLLWGIRVNEVRINEVSQDKT